MADLFEVLLWVAGGVVFVAVVIAPLVWAAWLTLNAGLDELHSLLKYREQRRERRAQQQRDAAAEAEEA